MSASTALEHRTTHASKVMERLGIEPGGGVLPRLSLLYTTALRRCEILSVYQGLPRVAWSCADDC